MADSVQEGVEKSLLEQTLAELSKDCQNYIIRVGNVYVRQTTDMGMWLTGDWKQAYVWHDYKAVSAAYRGIDRWMGLMPRVDVMGWKEASSSPSAPKKPKKQ